MISTDWCFIFRNDSSVIELKNCGSSTLWNVTRFFTVYYPECLPLSEMSVSYVTIHTTSINCCFVFILIICVDQSSYLSTVGWSWLILDPKCWFQSGNVWLLWIKHNSGRENYCDDASLISWILLLICRPLA